MESLDFDDVLLSPVASTVNSRSDVDISVQLSDSLLLKFPVIASPMLGIVDADFAIKLSELGGMAILHRFYETLEDNLVEIVKVKDAGAKLGVAIGMDSGYELMLSYNPDILLVDVANGYTASLLHFCNRIKNYIQKHELSTALMAGNVCTQEGVINLSNSGVDIIRVGIGSGGLCSTRNVTGVGVPQITALQDCSVISRIKIISDGGIRTSGDAVKAFVAGADAVMIGSLFGQTYESPAKNSIFGMASKKLQDMRYTQIKSIEGIEKAIEKKYSLQQFVEEFSWGIRSAGTYLNARNLQQMELFGKFVKVGKNTLKELN